MGYTRIGVLRRRRARWARAIIRAIGRHAGRAAGGGGRARRAPPRIGQDAGWSSPASSRRRADHRPATPAKRGRRLDRLLRAGGDAGARRAAAQPGASPWSSAPPASAPPTARSWRAAAKQIPIVFAANMSVGVNVMLKLVADAARALGPGYDLEIVEAHHRAKRDAPSGTALRLAEALAEATGRELASDGALRTARRRSARAPPTRSASRPCAAATSSATTPSTSWATASASRSPTAPRSRDTFAVGAVRAALWVAGRSAARGLYDMRATSTRAWTTCATCCDP